MAICAGLLMAGVAATAAAVYYVLSHDVPEMAKDRGGTLKTALLVLGGSGVLAGLYVAHRKHRTDAANRLRDQDKLFQDKLFTERYTAAVAQLGSPAAAVRLGGVYALARIADDSDRDRPTCFEMLCAYLRMPYDPASPDTEPAERQVRTTAQTAIAARLRPEHPGFWAGAQVDLTGAYLIDPDFGDITADFFNATGATFDGPAFFSRATFNLTAGFAGATFSEAAHFTRATFNGRAEFDAATFSGYSEFDRATFNQDAGFGKAMFNGGAGFNGATFSDSGAVFDLAGFGGAAMFDVVRFRGHVSFAGATFSEPAQFTRATFNRDAVFSGAKFKGALFNETAFNGGAGFDSATFIEDALFDSVTFSGRPVFGGATFNEGAWFDEATFSRDHPPVWPGGSAEPAGIVWDRPADPQAPVPGQGPDPTADLAAPPSGP